MYLGDLQELTTASNKIKLIIHISKIKEWKKNHPQFIAKKQQ